MTFHINDMSLYDYHNLYSAIKKGHNVAYAS